MDELARLKQNPVSGLRQVQFVAVVGPDTPPSGKTAGAYSLQVVWPYRLPDPDYKLITYSILPVFQVPPESSDGDTTVGKVLTVGKQSASIALQGVLNVVRPDNTRAGR